MTPIVRYPRTPHVAGSRLQPGDEDLPFVDWEALPGETVVVEEKVDGSNCAVSFLNGELILQSRGHRLTGGARERQFNLFKQWAAARQHALRDRLGERYIMYGEWTYARHTIYYDALPHYFLEFDVFDRERGVFLCSASRARLLAAAPVVSVRVLSEAVAGKSGYQTAAWRDALRHRCETLGLDAERALAESDAAGLMEGLYFKREREGIVTGRAKFVRPSFRTAVEDSESHWQDRPIIPNGLAVELEAIFAD